MRYYRTGFDVTIKSDLSPVTQADREAEAAIVESLVAACPDYGMLGEELGRRGNQETRWIIDPIDGTRNFVRHIPLWATLIALEDRGELVVAVMHVPTTGELYTARRGAGARKNGEPIHVSKVDTLSQAFFIHAGLNLVRREGWWDAITRIADATDRQRGFGDYVGYGLVAEGKAEIYAELDLKPWDLAAPRLVVEEAGGRFTDLHGEPTIYSGSALATNGLLHAATLASLRG